MVKGFIVDAIICTVAWLSHCVSHLWMWMVTVMRASVCQKDDESASSVHAISVYSSHIGWVWLASYLILYCCWTDTSCVEVTQRQGIVHVEKDGKSAPCHLGVSHIMSHESCMQSTWCAASVQLIHTDCVWHTCWTASVNHSLTHSYCVVDVFYFFHILVIFCGLTQLHSDDCHM